MKGLVVILKDFGGIVTLCITAFLCVIIIIISGIYVSSEETVNKPQKQQIAEYHVSSQESKKQESSTAVSVSATPKGKVIEQFISPYKSKTSYNRVYIKNRAEIDLDIKKYLEAKNPIKLKKNSEVQILIMHTHTTECFLPEDRDYYTDQDPTRTRNQNENITAVGDVISEKLNNAGFKTVHDKTEHDYPAYNGSYNRSGETVKKNLEKYPSIKIVIDLHRDSIAGNGTDRVKPIVEINGKKAAQVMLVMGCGETVANHKNWEKNFTFAVKYQQTMEALYPGLARQLALVSSRYNQHLTTGSILLEIGTESNSLEEAKYGGSLAADALISYLNTLV
jgi:stage II sporulation protein P